MTGLGTGARIGVDVGGTKCLAVAVVDGSLAGEIRVATPASGEAVLDTVAELATTLADKAGVPLAAVGVGLPGLVDRTGVLRFAPNLRGGTGIAFRAGIEARLGVPVGADNDATCAAWGEHELGAAQGIDEVVLVTLGTGIGGGIVTAGRVQRGANGFGGEIGHIVVDPSGPHCPCGRRGCWERFASGSGLGRLAREAAQAGRAGRVLELAGGDPDNVRGEHVTQAVAEGDEEAGAILDDFAVWIALGLANLANIFDPQTIVLGGGLVEVGAALLDRARAAFDRELEGQVSRPPVTVVPAQLGARAGAIGAAFLTGDDSSDKLSNSGARETVPDR